jgi:hypothetical protein
MAPTSGILPPSPGMGHLIFPDFGSTPPAPDGPSRTHLTVLVDSAADTQPERIEIQLPPAWGEPEIASMILKQMFKNREHVDITDPTGETLRLISADVRAFWTGPAEAWAR